METSKENFEERQDEHNRQTSSGGKEQIVIPVIQESATVHKEVVETGKVRIHKTVTEEKALVNLPIINESYDISRVPVNTVHDTPPPAVRYEGDTMIIPVIKEITVMTIRYEVVEELRITKKYTETPLMQEVTLRTEHVTVDRTQNSPNQE